MVTTWGTRLTTSIAKTFHVLVQTACINQFNDISEIITLKKHVFSTAGKRKATNSQSGATKINTELNNHEINNKPQN